MNGRVIYGSFFLLIILGGCATQATPPADFWGGIGFAYETNHGSDTNNRTTTTIGFEKELGNGFGIGGEFSGQKEKKTDIKVHTPQ